jgi:hypothetical protein
MHCEHGCVDTVMCVMHQGAQEDTGDSHDPVLQF